MKPGDLVVFPREPALGVGRVVSAVDDHGVPSLRVLLYDRAAIVVRAAAACEPCPAGVWRRDAVPRG